MYARITHPTRLARLLYVLFTISHAPPALANAQLHVFVEINTLANPITRTPAQQAARTRKSPSFLAGQNQ